MNPFNKNPFANKNTNTRIISNNINFNETQKIENIRENMNKIKKFSQLLFLIVD